MARTKAANNRNRPHLRLEEAHWSRGLRFVAGLDEAGRGAWAGPVVAAAVIFPAGRVDLSAELAGVNDSKKLSPRRRETLYPLICAAAVAFGVGISTPAEVDRDGLVPATRAAMGRALRELGVAPDALLIDAVDLRSVTDLPQESMYFGDSISLSIAAASIVAKVTRDRIMVELDAQHPHYGFARHKGYGTEFHRAALDKFGPVGLHRKSFRPIAAILCRSQGTQEYGQAVSI